MGEENNLKNEWVLDKCIKTPISQIDNQVEWVLSFLRSKLKEK